MASMKNTIVLGCFILAAAILHAFLTPAPRYSATADNARKRFDTVAGVHEIYLNGWKPYNLNK